MFLGGGSIKGMLAEIGGKMTAEAFDLILKKFDLDVGFKISRVKELFSTQSIVVFVINLIFLNSVLMLLYLIAESNSIRSVHSARNSSLWVVFIACHLFHW